MEGNIFLLGTSNRPAPRIRRQSALIDLSLTRRKRKETPRRSRSPTRRAATPAKKATTGSVFELGTKPPRSRRSYLQKGKMHRVLKCVATARFFREQISW